MGYLVALLCDGQLGHVRGNACVCKPVRSSWRLWTCFLFAENLGKNLQVACQHDGNLWGGVGGGGYLCSHRQIITLVCFSGVVCFKMSSSGSKSSAEGDSEICSLPEANPPKVGEFLVLGCTKRKCMG